MIEFGPWTLDPLDPRASATQIATPTCASSRATIPLQGKWSRNDKYLDRRWLQFRSSFGLHRSHRMDALFEVSSTVCWRPDAVFSLHTVHFPTCRGSQFLQSAVLPNYVTESIYLPPHECHLLNRPRICRGACDGHGAAHMSARRLAAAGVQNVDVSSYVSQDEDARKRDDHLPAIAYTQLWAKLKPVTLHVVSVTVTKPCLSLLDSSAKNGVLSTLPMFCC